MNPTLEGDPTADPPVIVYTRTGCETCQAVKEFLTEKGVAFVEKDIALDPVAADELATLTHGAATAPVTVAGTKVVVGFDPSVLARELGLN
ncbi:MAG TPA: glutaredoxin family protein [Planctomycetota bacterium]